MALRLLSCMVMMMACSAWGGPYTWNRSLPRGTQIGNKAMRLSGPGNFEAAFDGKFETAWCVEAPGLTFHPPAPTIKIVFDRPRHITGIRLVPSHAASLDMAKRYPRPSEVRLVTDAGVVVAQVDDTYVRATTPAHGNTPGLESLRHGEMVQIGYETGTYLKPVNGVNGRRDLTLTPVLTSTLEIAVWKAFDQWSKMPVCISEIRVFELDEPTK